MLLHSSIYHKIFCYSSHIVLEWPKSHILISTVLITFTAVPPPFTFQKQKTIICSRDLATKVYFSFVLELERTKRRFCGSERKNDNMKMRQFLLHLPTSRLLNQHTTLTKVPHTTSNSTVNNKVLVQEWNKVGNSQQSQSTSKKMYRDRACTHTNTHTSLCTQILPTVPERQVRCDISKRKWIQTTSVVLYVSTGYCLLH